VSFLTPLALLLSLLAAPIILMYMLRLRRRELLVSSTLLWQKLLRDREANAPWQKLRRNLLLFLQLLILALLVLALTRPFIPVPTVVSGSVVVLLDGSASMQATDVELDRFTAAKSEILILINNLGGLDRMTIIQVDQTPHVLASATNDRAVLRRALDMAQPGTASGDWAAAFALATGAAQGFRDARIVIVSDGGLPAGLPPLPAETVYLPIGQSGENLAISALATRERVPVAESSGEGSPAGGPQLFASVSNNGQIDRQALLSLSLDGALYDSRRITIPAGSSSNLTWQLPEGTAVIEARLSENEQDYLALDNVARAVHEGGAANRALLVTSGNLFLERIFSVLPGIELFRSSPENLATGETASGFDLYIFDGIVLPDPLPTADMLIINPPASNALFQVTGVFSTTTLTRLSESPLLQYVEWPAVNVMEAKMVTAPWAQTIIGAEGGPLLLAGEAQGQRIAILTFDLHHSDLPLRIAFPILMANITDWLNPGRAFDAPTGLQPGEPVSIRPGATTTAVTVVKPDQTSWTAAVAEADLFFTETEQLGLYQVSLRDASGVRPAGAFAVNLFAPGESAIAPATTIQVGQTTVSTAGREDVGQRELWPWLAAAALFVLIVEWWVYHRGPRWPQLNGLRPILSRRFGRARNRPEI
jgi:Ca-activated chloride channel homolog